MSTELSTSVPRQASARPADGDRRLEFVGIGWEGYRALLKIRGEKSRPQMIYLDGDVHLVSPSNMHECLKKRLGQIVVEVASELRMPLAMAGETTYRRRKKKGGVQPDESFYLANAARVVGKIRTKKLDLRFDPPPDLVIEVVHTHDARAALEVLRRLGVPEVWVGSEDGLRILIRQPNGRYDESKTSLGFPFLTSDENFEWANRLPTGMDSEWTLEIRRWIQGVLIPRVRGQAE